MTSIEPIQPLYELKGHQAPVLTVEYSGASCLGERILASGSGKVVALHELILNFI